MKKSARKSGRRMPDMKNVKKLMLNTTLAVLMLFLCFLIVLPVTADGLDPTEPIICLSGQNDAAEEKSSSGASAATSATVTSGILQALDVSVSSVRIGEMSTVQSNSLGARLMFDRSEDTRCRIGITTFSGSLDIFFTTAAGCNITDCSVDYEDNGGRRLIWTLYVRHDGGWTLANGNLTGTEYRLSLECVDRSVSINEITMYGKKTDQATHQNTFSLGIPQTGDIALALTTVALVSVVLTVISAKKQREKE